VPRERHVADVIREAFRRGGLIRGVRRAEAVLQWAQVVGPEVARFSSAVGLTGGVLIVDVPDPETAMHLGMQRHHILAAYRDRLGSGAVRDVRFRVGRAEPDDDPPTPAAPDVPPDPESVAALARAMHALDASVAGPAMRAGKALLTLHARRRAAGWRSCAVCGVPCEPDPGSSDPWCPVCTRHANAPRVQRAVERLTVHPDDPCDALTADERAVAALLALTRLRAAAVELLPQVLGEPTLLPQLEQLARATAALHHGLALASVTDEHVGVAVDPRVLRALGRWGAHPQTPRESP
jgi:hypothetical protein